MPDGDWTLTSFARLVTEMRSAQRRYFANRIAPNLEESKRLERAVDAALMAIGDARPLFGEGTHDPP